MTPDVEDAVEWPTHCSYCGTELVSEVRDSIVNNDWNDGSPVTMLAEDVCPNPDCPGKKADIAQATSEDGEPS